VCRLNAIGKVKASPTAGGFLETTDTQPALSTLAADNHKGGEERPENGSRGKQPQVFLSRTLRRLMLDNDTKHSSR
jgi:hypothetical protein